MFFRKEKHRDLEEIRNVHSISVKDSEKGWGWGKKHDINTAVFGGHFMTSFYRTRGWTPWSLCPHPTFTWIYCW